MRPGERHARHTSANSSAGESWVVVGAGRCGLQLARSMVAKGVRVAGLVEADSGARRRARRCLPGVLVLRPADALPPGRNVLIAVPDRALEACAEELAGRPGAEFEVAIHTSGARPAAALQALRRRSCGLASLHPLMSFSRGDGPLLELAGVTAALEGDPRGVRVARRLARQLGLKTVLISTADKPLYHALAAMAANLTHVLLVAVCQELARIGPGLKWSRQALAPLVLQAVHNALATGDLSLLTGPLVRGDEATVCAHLSSVPRHLVPVYVTLAGWAVAALQDEGRLSPRRAAKLATALTEAKRCGSFANVRLDEEG